MSSRTLFRNAAVVGRSDGGQTYSVVIHDGKIQSIVESETQVDDDGYEVIDLRKSDGSSYWIAPSLVDHHTHFSMNALTSHRYDLQTAPSAKSVLERVKIALTDPKYDPKEEINFVGVNMRNAGWTDNELINKQSLDELTDRPLFLIYNGYHSMCLNSPALRIGGHDPEGHDGMLVEQDAFDMMKKLSNVKDEVLDLWVEQEAKRAASLGVTKIIDLEWDFNITNWQRRYSRGFRSLRVEVGFYDNHLLKAIEDGYKTGDIVPNTGGLITVGPYKIITDGSLGSQTAYCHDPYPGTTDNYGILAIPPKSLSEMLEFGTQHNFKLAVHAIGDHANHLVLKTFQSMKIKHLEGSSIEHAQLLDFNDLELFKELNLIASIQPSHLVDDRELCHNFWPGREGRAYAFRSIVEAGITIKLGSDCPIAPLDPWDALAVSISRSGVGEGEDGNPFCEEQIIDLKTAWIGSTSNDKASIEEGDLADLCILGTDPLKCDATGLRKMVVRGTMLGGDWTHKIF